MTKYFTLLDKIDCIYDVDLTKVIAQRNGKGEWNLKTSENWIPLVQPLKYIPWSWFQLRQVWFPQYRGINGKNILFYTEYMMLLCSVLYHRGLYKHFVVGVCHVLAHISQFCSTGTATIIYDFQVPVVWSNRDKYGQHRSLPGLLLLMWIDFNQYEYVITSIIKCGKKILIHSQTSQVQPWKFRQWWILSSHTMWCCIYVSTVGLTLIHVSKKRLLATKRQQ